MKVSVTRKQDIISIRLPFQLKKRGSRKELDMTGQDDPKEIEPRKLGKALPIALARAHCWQRALDNSEFATICDLAKHFGYDNTYVSRLLNLTLLAPDIVEAILAGREPSGLSLEMLTRNPPLDWEEQRRKLGFPPSR